MCLEENFMQYVEIDNYEGIHLTHNVFFFKVATMSYELKYEYRFISRLAKIDLVTIFDCDC